MAATSSIGGLISGLDTNSILDQLKQAAEAPINNLQSRKDALNQQSVAWSQFEGLLLSFRSLASQLGTPGGVSAWSTSSGRPDLATAAAGAGAAPGAYTFTVEALAQTHQLASQGYADVNQTEVGSGTVSIAVGDSDPVVVAVDGFTLSELRDAINNAGTGVSAAIINDGSDLSPYRLVLTSSQSGMDGEMDVDIALSGGTMPVLSEIQAAQDAEIHLGSGAGAITVTSSSNTISGVVPGVTMNLLSAAPGTPVIVTVSADTNAIRSRIEDFVTSYNQIADFFAQQFNYDAQTGQTGTLFGNYELESLQQNLAAGLTNPVIGATGDLRALSRLGIRYDSSGKLTIDSAVLASALRDHLNDVVGVFAATAKPTNAHVSYLTATADTKPSGAVGYEVNITQAATRSRLSAGVAQTDPLAVTETLTINGVVITLSAGMTQSQVVAEINTHTSQTGVTASATGADGQGSGNYLTLTRSSYGSPFHLATASTVSNQGGNAATGIGTVQVSDTEAAGESGTGTGASGLDVAGTIGGRACAGSGQRLTASEGDPKGLSLLVTASSPGGYGSLVYTVGAAAAAFRVSLSATDSQNGTVARAQSYLTDSANDIDTEITRLRGVVDQEQGRLRASFTAMESALAHFQSQSQFLANQIAQIKANA